MTVPPVEPPADEGAEQQPPAAPVPPPPYLPPAPAGGQGDFRADPPPSGTPYVAPPPGVSLPAPGEPTTAPPAFQRRDSFGQDADGWYLPASSTNRPPKRPATPPSRGYGPPPDPRSGYGPAAPRPTPGWGPNPKPRPMPGWQVALVTSLCIIGGSFLLLFGLCLYALRDL